MQAPQAGEPPLSSIYSAKCGSANDMESADMSDGNAKQHEPLPSIHHARSRTDPPAPESHQQKSHLHLRLGSHALRNKTFNTTSSKNGGEHQHHSRRQHAKDAVQSAMDLKPPINFDHLLRRDKKHHDSNRSNATNAASSQNQTQRNSNDSSAQQPEKPEPRPVSYKEVKSLRQSNQTRESSLRDSLLKVEETAMSSTRRLDDTYYAILEKASFLRSTLASLQQLADESRQMHQTFQSDSSRLEENMEGKFKSFEDFAPQEKAIDGLVEKLARAKTSTEKLNRRLEEAWTRVEGYEERERAEQVKRRKRYRVSSFLSAVVLAMVVVVLVAKHHVGLNARLHVLVDDEEGGGRAYPIVGLLKPLIKREEDPYLKKLFDEL